MRVEEVQVPTNEDAPRRPFGDYGTKKAEIEEYLLREARLGGFPATLLHPGHIVGPGWEPLNPAGHFNSEVFGRLARGEEVILPNLGLETVHHVHADQWSCQQPISRLPVTLLNPLSPLNPLIPA